MEGTAVTELMLEIVLSVLGIAAIVIGAWVGKGQRELQESGKLRDFSEGIKNFNPVLWDLLWAAAGAAVARIQDEADEFAYGDAYDSIKREVLAFLKRYAELTGVKADDLLTEENLDRLIRYVLEQSIASYKRTVKELEKPEPAMGELIKQEGPPKVDLTDYTMDRLLGRFRSVPDSGETSP